MIEMVMTIQLDPTIRPAEDIAALIVPGYGIESCEIARTGDEVLVYARGMAGGSSLRTLAPGLRAQAGVLAVDIGRPQVIPW